MSEISSINLSNANLNSIPDKLLSYKDSIIELDLSLNKFTNFIEEVKKLSQLKNLQKLKIDIETGEQAKLVIDSIPSLLFLNNQPTKDDTTPNSTIEHHKNENNNSNMEYSNIADEEFENIFKIIINYYDEFDKNLNDFIEIFNDKVSEQMIILTDENEPAQIQNIKNKLYLCSLVKEYINNLINNNKNNENINLLLTAQKELNFIKNNKQNQLNELLKSQKNNNNIFAISQELILDKKNSLTEKNKKNPDNNIISTIKNNSSYKFKKREKHKNESFNNLIDNNLSNNSELINNFKIKENSQCNTAVKIRNTLNLNKEISLSKKNTRMKDSSYSNSISIGVHETNTKNNNTHYFVYEMDNTNFKSIKFQNEKSNSKMKKIPINRLFSIKAKSKSPIQKILCATDVNLTYLNSSTQKKYSLSGHSKLEKYKSSKNFSFKRKERNFQLSDIFENNREQIIYSKDNIRDMNIKNLIEIINNVYKFRNNRIKKTQEGVYTKSTLEIDLFSYLKAKYGLKNLIIEWYFNIVLAIQKYSKFYSEVCLFALVLRNEIDEGYIQMQKKIKEIVEGILRPIFEYNTNTIDKILRDQKLLTENEWNTIIKFLYGTDENLINLFQGHINVYIDNFINDEEITLKLGRNILLSDFLNQLIFFNLRLRKKYLKNLFNSFKKEDKNRTGILNHRQFKNLIKNFGFIKENVFEEIVNKIIDLADKENSGQITFNDAVESLESFQISGNDGNNITILDKLSKMKLES